MLIWDNESRMRILSFDHIELNQALDSSVFRLDYPEGVDVIRDGA